MMYIDEEYKFLKQLISKDWLTLLSQSFSSCV